MEIIIWFLTFNLLMWCVTLIDLQVLKNPCFPGIRPTWSRCMIFEKCCWILFTRSFFSSCSMCASFPVYRLRTHLPASFKNASDKVTLIPSSFSSIIVRLWFCSRDRLTSSGHHGHAISHRKTRCVFFKPWGSNLSPFSGYSSKEKGWNC